MAFKRQLGLLPYNHETSILSFSKYFEDRLTDGETDKVTCKDDYPSRRLKHFYMKLGKFPSKTKDYAQ